MNHTSATVVASLLLLLLATSGCSIDDIRPINQLTTENTIRDEASAQQVLNGIYDLGRDFDVGAWPLYLAAYGNEGTITGAGLSGSQGYNTNQVPADNRFLTNLYSKHYQIINSCNFLIERLEAGAARGISETRSAEMQSEARFQRALSYFSLLRYFGRFYDTGSELGVVLRTDFATELETAPRNTVAEVYAQIVEDLEYAMENGPRFVEHFYSGAFAATALLGKVELYRGNYERAATLAAGAIDNEEGYVLEAQYGDIFTNSFRSSEVIFAPYSGSGAEGGSTMDQVNRTTYSEQLRTRADAQVGEIGDGDLTGAGAGYDPRFLYAYSEATRGPNRNGKYPFFNTSDSQGNTLYHLRMAELYLIYAEAEARRPGGDLDAALLRLNQIRNRAGVSPHEFTNTATLLQDIRREKLLELFFENGEGWFDLVRYASLGDLDISSVKPTVVSENQYVLPIPITVIVGNNEVKQNPGY